MVAGRLQVPAGRWHFAAGRCQLACWQLEAGRTHLARGSLRQADSTTCSKNCVHFSICACHPCAGAMLIFSVSFQFYRMILERNPPEIAFL